MTTPHHAKPWQLDFRAAHHWYRGYSDALAAKPAQPQDEAYAEDYSRGYSLGEARR